MGRIVDNPGLIFVIALVGQWGAASLGVFLRTKRRPLNPDDQEDLGTVRTATLTLLALIIGFSFSERAPFGSRYRQPSGRHHPCPTAKSDSDVSVSEVSVGERVMSQMSNETCGP
jgi:hypothetical protein